MASKSIEDAYPLSPMQEGILFHSLYTQEHDVYIMYFSCTFEGLDVSAFEQAWQRIVDRHTTLRTAFVWEGVEKPLQVVGRRVKVPIERQDWRGMTVTEQQARFEEYI